MKTIYLPDGLYSVLMQAKGPDEGIEDVIRKAWFALQRENRRNKRR